MTLPQTAETGLRHNGDLSYNIQVRQCHDGSIQQRHLWHRTSLGEHNPPRVEEWIPSFTRNFEVASRGMRPASPLSPEVDAI